MQLLAVLGSYQIIGFFGGCELYQLTSFGSGESAFVGVECDREGALYSVHATVYITVSLQYINLQPSNNGKQIRRNLYIFLFDTLWFTGRITYTVKRFAVFSSPDGMSRTKLPLAGNNLIIPGQESWVSDMPAEDGKISNLFYSVWRPWRLHVCTKKIKHSSAM